MYRVLKTIEIAGAHALDLPYESKCQNLHGHNWVITVECQVEDESLLANGMVVDFSKITSLVKELDHKNLNEFVAQPTAENIAKFLHDQIPHCVRVTVQESQGNIAVYENL